MTKSWMADELLPVMKNKYRKLFVFNWLGTKGVMLAPYFASEMLQCLISGEYILNNEVDIKRFL
jgi:glycine oxidase